MNESLHANLAASVRFHVRGLGQRDETLFKSFVRLIAHRTNQRWVPVESDDSDVWVVPQTAAAETNPFGQVLVVGGSPSAVRHTIGAPFRADELEQCLNKLGADILVKGPPGHPVVMLPAWMRLSRWPPLRLINTPERIRLATVLTAAPVSLLQLQQRSGLQLAVCESFVRELLQEGLLAGDVRVPPPKCAPPTPAATPGLLAKIRNRLRRIHLPAA